MLAEESDADASRLGIIQQEITAKQAAAALDEKNTADIAKQKLLIAQADVKRQNAIADAQYTADKRKKTVSEVEAVIDTAAAVIKAAPNIALMIIAGAVGIAQTAVIASQKIPPAVHLPIPTAAEGGPLVGPSHAGGGIAIEAEGGEWIAPKWMVNNPRTAPVIDSLENIRQSKPHFAEGGTVASGVPASPATQSFSVDYDKLADAMAKINVFTSIKEIRDANRKFANIVYNKSSI